MRKRSISDFFEKEFKQQAQNDNYQNIASYIDGFRPTARKSLFTIITHNIKELKKVDSLANATSDFTEYLGGAKNIEGVIINIARGYSTSNNISMMGTKGNFGQRLNNKPGEARYIKVKLLSQLNDYFNSLDSEVLIGQEFEGRNIEPKFLIPVLPFILINGSLGIGTGHAQLILPRNPKDIKDILYKKLKNSTHQQDDLLPYWKGFRGIVKKVDKGKYETYGKYEIDKLNILITELPIGYQLKSDKKSKESDKSKKRFTTYIEKLKSLVEDKIIKSYKDLSDTKKDEFRFEVKVDSKFDMSEDNILNSLGLITKFTENYTCMTENNSIKVFEDSNEILQSFINIRLEYYQKRKDHLIKKILGDIAINEPKFLFVSGVVDGSIVIHKKKKTEIETQLKSIDGITKVDNSFDYLLRMSISSLTYEKVQELRKKISSLKKELKDITNKDIKETWLEELDNIDIG